MSTITETITEKLLDRIHDPVGLQAVLQEYSHSKGPLYLALAHATSIMIQKLETTAQQYQVLDIKLQERQEQSKQTEQKLHGLDQQVATQSNILASVEHKVQDNNALLDQVKSLAGLGFGLGELGKLHKVLVDNIPKGGEPHDVVNTFFKFVSAYPHLAEVDSEVQVKEQLIASLDGKLDAKQVLIDEVKTLSGLGLGTKELVKLRDRIVKFGASQGMQPAETLKLFFSYVGKFVFIGPNSFHFRSGISLNHPSSP